MALLGSYIDSRTIASFASNASASFAHGLPAAPDFLIVAGVGGQQMFLGSVMLSCSLACTVSFVAGTGATCGTGTSTVIGAMTLAPGIPLSLGNGLGIVARVGVSGDSICAVTTGAGATAGGVLTFILN